jgi:hypothetical protein
MQEARQDSFIPALYPERRKPACHQFITALAAFEKKPALFIHFLAIPYVVLKAKSPGH